MSNKVFKISDLCDMVRSQKFANELERETGLESGWHENMNEEDFDEEFAKLDDEEAFDKNLRKTADIVSKDIDLLMKAENKEEIDEIRKIIRNKVKHFMGEYILEEK